MSQPPSNITKELMAQLAEHVPGVNGSAVPIKLQHAVDYALQELVKIARPATRKHPAEPPNPVLFLVEKLRAFIQADRDTVSEEEMARLKKRRGRRGGRRGSVVCSSRPKSNRPKDWKPTPVPKSEVIRAHLKEMVSKSILLHGANEITIDTVVDCMFQREFEPHATIIKEGDPGDNLYLCTSGWIQVYKFIKGESKTTEGKEEGQPTGTAFDSNGKDRMVARLEQGATFGELALMYDAPRSATCKAGDDGCVCWAIDRVTFQEVVKNAVQTRRKMYTDALASIPILAPLTAYERNRLADCIEEEKFQIDDVILQEGESGSHFYFVLEGEVKINKAGYDTEVCDRLGKGAFFGEIALIMNVPRTATVTATHLTRTARIHRDVFERMMGKLGDILSRQMDLYAKYEEQIDPKAYAKKRKGGRKRGRRRSVVCSSSKDTFNANWKPVKIPKTDEQRTNILSVIGQNILFATMNEDERSILADIMSEKVYQPNDVIIKQGDDGDNFYIVAQGSIPISIEGKGQVYESQVGDAFGELALLYDAPRAATCVAGANGAVCWALDRDSFKHMMRKATIDKRKRNQDFLKSVEILSSLTDYEYGRLSDALTETVRKQGEIIVTEGEDGDDFYLIQKGVFKVTKQGIDEEICERLTSGKYFGEIALLQSKPRSATVTCVEDGILLHVDRNAFSKLLGSLSDILERNMDLYNKYTPRVDEQ